VTVAGSVTDELMRNARSTVTQGLANVVRHVIECHSNRHIRVYDMLDDVVSNNCQALP